MKLWIVDYVAGGRGCPAVLKGTLNQPWAWDVSDPAPPVDVPAGYVYAARHPVLDFDYWDINWVASGGFVDICSDLGLRVHPIPVEIIQSGGTATEKDYFYLLWSEWASIIDVQASRYEVERDPGTGQPVHHVHFPDAPVLLSVESFAVDRSKVPNVAAFKCPDVDDRLVCTDEFRLACESAGLKGLEFTELAGYAKDGFWG